MPFPTRYTRTMPIADDTSDIAIDRERGFIWLLSGGGYEWHTHEDAYLTAEGPVFFKVRMSDGVVVLSGQGPFVDHDYEETHTSPENIANNFEVWNMAVDPATGNLYVAVYNRFTGPGNGRIYCLNPTTLETLFVSPDLPVGFNRPDRPLIHGGYLYYHSGTRGASPQLAIHVSRMPLSLAQVDWSATVYAGIDTFQVVKGTCAIDNAGNAWYGNLKILGKISPNGTVTSYDLTASLNANACIMWVFYDAGTDNVGLIVELRTSNGTGSFVAPYYQVVKVSAATGVVSATFSAPATLRFSSAFTHLTVYDGRVLLRLDRGTSNTPDNRGALVDFDFRSMRIIRIYSLTKDWNLSPTVYDPYYGDSALDSGQRTQDFLFDPANRSIWAYNGLWGWIYPDVAYPEGTYGMWAWSLNECASYIHFPGTTWTSRNLAFDRERGVVWAMLMDAPTLFKVRTSDSTLLYSGRGDMPAGTDPGDWMVEWMDVSPLTGHVYVDDNNGDTVRLHCLDSTDLHLLHTSPYFPLPYVYIHWLVVYEQHVYAYLFDDIDYTTVGVARLPLDLSQIDWIAEWTPRDEESEMFSGTLALDGAGNIWMGSTGSVTPTRSTLARISPSGAVTQFHIEGQLPALTWIVAVGYDPVTPSIAILLENNQGRGRMARFNLNSMTVDAVVDPYQNLSGWGLGGSESRNWKRLPNGRVWLRLNHDQVTSAPILSSFDEFDVPTMTVVRNFNLTSDWCITNTTENLNAHDAARRTHGYLWDDCACCLWMLNGYSFIYPTTEYATGAEGLWKLPLPDEPASDCPGPQLPACPGPLEYFHDALLDQFISYGCKIKIKFQTFLTRMREGHEERIGEWQDPIWTFDITPALRDQADLDYLIAFFRARQGPLYIFKFFNPLDYQVQNEVYGVGDGVTQTFQLSRRYQTGIAGDGLYYVRPITLPAQGVQVFNNGVAVEEGLWGLCPLGGTVVFASPPAPGTELTWTGMYYTPVRFLNNRVYSIVEHYEHFEDQIMLAEERLGVFGKILDETESPDFVEVRFPDRYAQRATMGPEIDVITITSDSGGTFRTPQWKSAKIRFTVEETEQPQAAIASILAFFLNRKGRLYGFRAKDITDFSLDGPLLETADGTRTQFQLVKRYGSGAQSEVRTILKPNQDVEIFVDGVSASPQPTVAIGTGKVTFASPPAAGVTITAAGTFDVPVRFDSDEILFSIQGYAAFNLESIGLIETELGLPTFAIESPFPALMAVQAAPMPRLALPGQDSCQLPPRPAVTAYLEFRGGTTGSGAGTYSGLQVETPGSMYKLLAGATSLTVAFLVSHVKSGTPSGALGAVYPMSLFSHVMPGMGTDAALYASTGFTLYLADYGAGIALDAAIGAYTYDTSGSLCVPQLTLTPRVPAQGAVSASAITDNNLMHAYVVTFDWVSHRAYWSGTVYGVQDFPPDAFVYNTCFAGTGGADARLLEFTALKYVGSRDLTIGQGETANDGWLGVVGQAPQTPAFHSPLSAFVYEHLLLPTFTRVDMQRILRDVHAPILRYWGSKYSTGYANVQSPMAPGFDLFWWRADENVSIADTPTGAIAAWAPVACGFQWEKANSTVMSDEGQPRKLAITTMPALSDVLMLADGRRLLARQT